MKILVTGDSHTGALNLAVRSMNAGGEIPDGISVSVQPVSGGDKLRTEFWRDAGDHAEITVTMKKDIGVKRLPPDPTTDTVALCMPLWPARVLRPLVAGKHSVAEDIPGRQAISRSMFRRMVLDDQHHVLRLAEFLRDRGVQVIAVSAPGLFRDHYTLRQDEPTRVLTMFQDYRAIMLKELERRKVPVVDIPPECLDDEGFMRSEFRHADPRDEHHANPEFGKLMIRGLLEIASSNPLLQAANRS